MHWTGDWAVLRANLHAL